MDSITYKCPNCGGGLVFEPETQKFKCGYCLSVFTEEELKKMTPDSQTASETQTTPEASHGDAHNGLYLSQLWGRISDR